MIVLFVMGFLPQADVQRLVIYFSYQRLTDIAWSW